jgi:uncharacterized protein DUF3800
MFFHIDESGNTGNNLFDKNQPRLSYGLISSRTNVDALCEKEHKAIQKIIDEPLIHANKLGMKGLEEIAPLLIKIQKKIKFDFDYYFIEKLDYALVIFFDSVFDAGLNDAVKWDSYWTPLRYVLIHKLSVLFDEDLLKESWRLSIAKRIENHEEDIVTLLTEVKRRTENSALDERSKELIIDALNFGINKPLAIDFGHPDQRIISPNAVGFQFVVAAIARRTRKMGRKTVQSIVVDRQNEFNKAQIGTHYNLSRISEGINKASAEERQIYLNHPLYTNFSTEEITHKGLTDRELTISKSAESIGLQIVDVYLWLANKIMSGVQLPSELLKLWSLFCRRSLIDGISLRGMAERFNKFERDLPKLEDLTDIQMQLAKRSVERHRRKVRSL